MDYIKGFKLLGYNEIVESDHRAYMINVMIEEYFEEELSIWNNINKVMLNPAWRSHREKFLESIENQLNTYQLENDLELIRRSATYHQMEQVDEILTRIFNVATKKVEGMRRNILFLSEKERQRAALLYCKMQLRKCKEIAVDNKLMVKRKNQAQMNGVEFYTIC